MTMSNFTIAVVVVATPGIFISYQVYRFITNTTKRQEVTQGALGLKSPFRKRRRRKEHAIANLQSYGSVDDWIASLPRSAKVTLRRVNRIVKEQHGIQVECVGRTQQVLGWEHWLVCVDHETRATPLGLLSGCLLGSIRFLAANITEGSIDEFRIGDQGEGGNQNNKGKLVAWSCMIVKGKTMRNMWFYQRSEAAKCLIWFYTVRMAVERCLDLSLNHLDLGPSHTKDVKDLKTKYGFHSTLDWDQETATPNSDPQFHCDYSGPYVDVSSFYCTTTRRASSSVKKSH